MATNLYPIKGLATGKVGAGVPALWMSDTRGKLFMTCKSSLHPDASWVPWQPIHTPARNVTVAAATQLQNGVAQIFILSADDSLTKALMTAWQTEATLSASWSAWQTLGSVPGGAELRYYNCATAGLLPDGRTQLFATRLELDRGTLLTTWKLGDATSAWMELTPVPLPQPYLVPVIHSGWWNGLATGRLSDGRLQVFLVAGGTRTGLLSMWKTSLDPNASWSGWQVLSETDPSDSIAVASLADGRMQLWRLDGSGRGSMSTRWKVTTDPDAAWTDWMPFQTLLPSTAFVVFTAGRLTDGRIQLWAADRIGQLYSCWKLGGPNSAWSTWSPFHPGG